MSTSHSIFVSYTGDDLAAHADVVVAVLRKLGLLAIDHRDAGAAGTPSVEWCYQMIADCDIIVVLVAHRYGWVPPVAEGGDGSTSITWLEVRHARKLGKIVLPYLIKPGAMWRTDQMEGLSNPAQVDGAPNAECLTVPVAGSSVQAAGDTESSGSPANCETGGS